MGIRKDDLFVAKLGRLQGDEAARAPVDGTAQQTAVPGDLAQAAEPQFASALFASRPLEAPEGRPSERGFAQEQPDIGPRPQHATDSAEQDVGQTTAIATTGHRFYALEQGQHAGPFKSRLEE